MAFSFLVSRPVKPMTGARDEDVSDLVIEFSPTLLHRAVIPVTASPNPPAAKSA